MRRVPPALLFPLLLCASLRLGASFSEPYDQAGNRLSVTYGAGVSGNRTLNSVYDTLNRVANITDVTSGNLVTTYHYDLAGRRVGLLYPSGSNITTTFDALGRQTAITGSRTTTTPYSFNLTYDQYNNLAQQVETYQTVGGLGLSNRTVSLAYDSDNRLTQEVLGVTNATVTTNITSNYTYDAAFNRKAKVTTQKIGSNATTTVANVTYDYNAGDQLAWDHDTVANSTANFTYDGAGNRLAALLSPVTVPNATVAENITTAQFASLYAHEIDYVYDSFNRLANVTLNGYYSEEGDEDALTEVLNYRYDYQNRRMVRGDWQADWVAGMTPVNQLWQEAYDADGPVRDYYASSAGDWSLGIQEDWVRGSDWGGGIGGILYSQPEYGNATTAKYYNYDGRGDVVALTSNVGNITYAAAYNAYGQHATVTSGNVTTTGTQEVGTDTDLFRLTTKEEDPTGLSYQINRYLSLTDNNWLSRDPLGLATGPNPYTYVEQNNWTKFDPLGLSSIGDSLNDLVQNAQDAAEQAALAAKAAAEANKSNKNSSRGTPPSASAMGTPEPPGGPPFSVPGGGPDSYWKPGPGTTERPIRYGPNEPVGPSGSPQPNTSWDPNAKNPYAKDGHWDQRSPDPNNPGETLRKHFDRDGNEITPDEAHPSSNGPQPKATEAEPPPESEPSPSVGRSILDFFESIGNRVGGFFDPIIIPVNPATLPPTEPNHNQDRNSS